MWSPGGIAENLIFDWACKEGVEWMGHGADGRTRTDDGGRCGHAWRKLLNESACRNGRSQFVAGDGDGDGGDLIWVTPNGLCFCPSEPSLPILPPGSHFATSHMTHITPTVSFFRQIPSPFSPTSSSHILVSSVGVGETAAVRSAGRSSTLPFNGDHRRHRRKVALARARAVLT